jgi:hypothetical protein
MRVFLGGGLRLIKVNQAKCGPVGCRVKGKTTCLIQGGLTWLLQAPLRSLMPLCVHAVINNNLNRIIGQNEGLWSRLSALHSETNDVPGFETTRLNSF